MKSGFFNNTKRSSQWLDKNEAPKHFPKPEFHQKKYMVNCKVHYSFFKPGKTITAIKDCQQLDEMHEKQPALVNRNGPILLYDNANTNNNE